MLMWKVNPLQIPRADRASLSNFMSKWLALGVLVVPIMQFFF